MLFEKMNGRLVQILPADEATARNGRHTHGVTGTIEILFTEEEEQKARIDQAAEEEAARVSAEQQVIVEASISIQEKLARLGIPFDELRDAIMGVKT